MPADTLRLRWTSLSEKEEQTQEKIIKEIGF